MSEILVVHRIPASVTPLADWITEVADQVTLVTSAEMYEQYRGQFPRVVAVADYADSPEVKRELQRICTEQPITTLSGPENCFAGGYLGRRSRDAAEGSAAIPAGQRETDVDGQGNDERRVDVGQGTRRFTNHAAAALTKARSNGSGVNLVKTLSS